MFAAGARPPPVKDEPATAGGAAPPAFDRPSPEPDAGVTVLPLAEIERRYVLHVLRLAEGNKTLAAQRLGVDRRTLYRKLDRYEARRRARPP